MGDGSLLAVNHCVSLRHKHWSSATVFWIMLFLPSPCLTLTFPITKPTSANILALHRERLFLWIIKHHHTEFLFFEQVFLGLIASSFTLKLYLDKMTLAIISFFLSLLLSRSAFCAPLFPISPSPRDCEMCSLLCLCIINEMVFPKQPEIQAVPKHSRLEWGGDKRLM